jgi:hypothetical protein
MTRPEIAGETTPGTSLYKLIEEMLIGDMPDVHDDLSCALLNRRRSSASSRFPTEGGASPLPNSRYLCC